MVKPALRLFYFLLIFPSSLLCTVESSPLSAGSPLSLTLPPNTPPLLTRLNQSISLNITDAISTDV